ncbi:hypothetical protein JXJ21_04910 [candidate division KSB1 bacterium]|nr:hypothetical protein [candidate division KSB1 bacterium]
MNIFRRFMLFCWLIVPVLIFPKNIIQTLQSEKQADQLDLKSYLTYLTYALCEPSRLPPQYQAMTVKPIKSGTFLRLYLNEHQHLLDEPLRALLKTQNARPALDFNITSPSGKFRVHYDLSGYHAVSPTDNNQNGLPDYVEEATKALDYSFHLIVDSLGYRTPLSDGGIHGDEYDIYLLNLGSLYYGETWPETQMSQNPVTFSAYTKIHCNFGSSFPTRGIDALRVTCAHEFFHACHLTYSYRHEDIFFFEASSTWMEDVAYDYVNDYVNYLTDFFLHPETPFDYQDFSHEYGLALWNHMLWKKYGADVIRWAWERMAEKPERGALGALNHALVKIGSTFDLEFQCFSLWNYFTGSRTDFVKYYPEGNLYPEITFRNQFSFRTDISFADSSKKYAPVYYFFNDPDNSRTFSIILTNLEYHEQDWDAMSNYQLSAVSVPVEKTYEKLAERLHVRLYAPAIDFWRGQAVIISDEGDVQTPTFGPKTMSPAEKDGTILYLFPNPFIIGRHREVKLYFKLDKKSWVEAMVFSSAGRLVKEIRIDQSTIKIPGFVDKGNYPELEWDGTNDAGEYVGSGIYLFGLKIGNSLLMEKIAVVRE